MREPAARPVPVPYLEPPAGQATLLSFDDAITSLLPATITGELR